MLQFIQANIATILTLLVLIFVVFLAIRKIVKDKKSGIGACGQKCSNCAKMKNGECRGHKQY